jgi:hypothetical protein
MITEEISAVMIAHAENMTMQRQREAAKKKQPPSTPLAFFCKESEAASSL